MFKEWHVVVQGLVELHIALPNGCTDAHMIRVNVGFFQFTQTVDVDQELGSGQSHGHHGNQALAPCDQFGIWAVLVNQAQSLVQVLCQDVIKGCCFHEWVSRCVALLIGAPKGNAQK
jgi:hypothetical protein